MAVPWGQAVPMSWPRSLQHVAEEAAQPSPGAGSTPRGLVASLGLREGGRAALLRLSTRRALQDGWLSSELLLIACFSCITPGAGHPLTPKAELNSFPHAAWLFGGAAHKFWGPEHDAGSVCCAAMSRGGEHPLASQR